MYETEEQQVEALKKWWNENGKSIIAGIVIGLGAVFGWQAWTQHVQNQAAQASNIFDQLTISVSTNNADAVAKQSEILHKDFGSTPYSAFAHLMQAKMAYENGDAAAAEAALQSAMDKAPNDGIEAIAALRMARIKLAAGNADAAAAVLKRNPAPASFAGEYAVVEGDIARAKGDMEAARQAYENAIAHQVANPDLVNLKLEDLPPAS